MWLALSMAAKYQRMQLVERLTTQIIEGNRTGSLAAIWALAESPRPVLEPIVRAAASPDRKLAEGAQRVIDKLIEQWQVQYQLGHNSNSVADGLSELAAALDASRESFAEADGPWLTRTASAILRLANQVSPTSDFELTSHCEAVLAAAGRASNRPNGSGTALDVSPSPPAAPVIAITTNSANPTSSAKQSFDVTPIPELPNSAEAESAFSAPPQSAYCTLSPSDAASPLAAVHSQNASVKDELAWPAQSGDRRMDSADDDAARKFSRASSEVASRAAAKFSETTQRANTSESFGESLKTLESRALLKKWASADKSGCGPLEAELVRRGLGKPNAEITTALFSERVEDRIRLVNGIMTARGINTAAWLQLFTEDSDAEVRLAAITLMSTSNNAALMEQAYQASLHDRDPRVADLAGRLRERRDGVERR
jgi:hypothetical protein